MSAPKRILYSQINLNVLKLNESFVDGLLSCDRSDLQLDGLAALVRESTIDVFVKGIESAVQVKILRDIGTAKGQRRYFSPPLRAADFVRFHAAHP